MSEEKASPNLHLWNQVCKTDPKMTKKVSFGRSFTAIDPTYQTHQATAMWGPQGVRWGLADLVYTTFEAKAYDKEAKCEVTTTSMMLEATLFYPGNFGKDGLVRVAADMRFKPGDDVAKKLRTMCKSKALAELGFGADVFMGQYDDEAYVSGLKNQFEEKDSFLSKARASIKKTTTRAGLDACKKRLEQLMDSDQLDSVAWQELSAVLAEQEVLVAMNGGASENVPSRREEGSAGYG